MKTLVAETVVLLLFVATAFAQERQPKLQSFQYWAGLKQLDKLTFLLGVTNGLGAARVTVLECKNVTCADMTPRRREQIACILLNDELGVLQAIAMIDKYYENTPEKWNEPIGLAIIDALTVSTGPCGTGKTQRFANP